MSCDTHAAKDRFDEIAGCLLDRERGQVFIVDGAFRHHARDGKTHLLANLRDGQLGDGNIAATLLREHVPRTFDGAFATFDRDVHQFTSTCVVRGRPTSAPPATK